MGLSIFVFSWLFDFLLLMGISQLYPGKISVIKIVIAAAINGLYVVGVMLFWFSAVVSPLLRCVAIIITGIVAFGWSLNGIRCCGVFLLLHVAISGVLQPDWPLRPLPLLLASILVLLFTILGFPEKDDMVSVEVSYGKNHMTLTALRDTGNTLRDPLTGKPVLILGADVAEHLTGLSPQQLRTPVETIGALPGLRLIPYRGIGGEGLLLALRLPRMRVGARAGSGIVAFAPEVLSKDGKFQALTGGAL